MTYKKHILTEIELGHRDIKDASEGVSNLTYMDVCFIRFQGCINQKTNLLENDLGPAPGNHGQTPVLESLENPIWFEICQ